MKTVELHDAGMSASLKTELGFATEIISFLSLTGGIF